MRRESSSKWFLYVFSPPSRLICTVPPDQLQTGRFVGSSDLVPGDIYEISDPNLSQFPSDSLLLSGDCIVNESMLTGNSLLTSSSIWEM